MFGKVTKLLASTLVFTTLFTSSIVPAFASNGKHEYKHDKDVNHKPKHKPQTKHPVPAPEPVLIPKPMPNPVPVQDGNVQSLGAFRIGKTAVVFALKYGGRYTAKIMENVSPRYARLFKDWSYTIGDKLEHMTDAYEARLIKFMIDELDFPPAAARNIAWAISMLI